MGYENLRCNSLRELSEKERKAKSLFGDLWFWVEGDTVALYYHNAEGEHVLVGWYSLADTDEANGFLQRNFRPVSEGDF